MLRMSPVAYPTFRGSRQIAGRSGLALVAWLGFVLPPVSDPRRMRVSGAAYEHVMLVAAPSATADITAAPIAPVPQAATPGFSVHSRPILAAIVDARRLHGWTRTRIGGLYGP